MGSHCLLDGMPYIRMVQGSSVVLGNDVTLISNRRHNPLLEHSVSIRTLTRDARIEIGNCVGISGSRLVCSNHILIGDYTIIGPNSLIYDSEGHDFSPEIGWKGRVCYTGRPICIGSKCFIGTGCIIMSGVTIGDCCVVSAGTVLKEDLPSGHKAEGNPAVITPLPKILGGQGEYKLGTKTVPSPTNIGAENQAIQSLHILDQIKTALEFDFELHADDQFREYEGWDSLAFLSLVVILKDEYGKTLTPEVFNSISTWRELLDWIKE